jgi:hypothetical protein
MGALVSREVLEALQHPKVLAELPDEKTRKQVRAVVTKAGSGDYVTIRLGPLAGPVREAARQVQLHGKPGAKLARSLPQIAQLPGY